ncbi:hypothetical protein EYZ11_005104 [Aspergillus tanneri]|uniref:Tafazzin n=1 Tax=Aspergillus tanneri TaxID=1220188 RepID=A0A4S3JL47_9EURO|nr:uncharacterized protein ATNIH1004_008253 [Aspergillus tanneri]KAA8644056.1 hypothetical protein ATNIH1004_008253 [Aspergillus tanneri]THC95417.1 hypothetical protein EYZ11_005104 [Aspergillus tanneri]
MPKKHHKPLFAKPASTAHHTLVSSGSQGSHNDRSRPSQASSSESPSVNDLISHLRRTQVSRSSLHDGSASPSRHLAPRSVHPSLRNLLELPETPPPRPRPGSRRIGVGGRPLRTTAGPPPPESWLLGNYATGNSDENNPADIEAAQTGRIVYRLDRLPGKTVPPRHTLLHMLLSSMALHWTWHLEYDGQFLALLPTHIKELLLSYISVYARDQPVAGMMHGLRPLFEKRRVDQETEDRNDLPQDTDTDVSQLDLGGAIGRWLELKQLFTELFVSQKPKSLQHTSKELVPSSWDVESDDDADASASRNVSLPKAPSQGLRFQNLRFLSLAHPNPTAANWNSLINLLSRLSILTHLSLAHWPVPTVTPNAANVRVRHPTQRSLTFSYGGTDSYALVENNWAEAAGILRRLSRVTYCLKWLDLEGCGDWIPALNWDGVGPDGEVYSSGPEWNGAWRDIEFIRLGPGWLPHIDDSELAQIARPMVTPRPDTATPSPARSLTTSIHSPSSGLEEANLPWDVELERIKYQRSKELEQFREIMQTAKAVQQRVLRLRRESRGKWVRFSFGIEGLEEDVLKRLLDMEYLRLVP